MSDLRERELERAVVEGDPGALEALKRSWLRTTFRVCPDCDRHVPEQHYDRHRYEHEYDAFIAQEAKRIWTDLSDGRELLRRERGGVLSAADQGIPRMPIPGTGLASRPRREPIWHRQVLPSGELSLTFFDHAAEHGAWTNLEGPGGSLPAANHFYLYAVGLIPDADAPPREVRRIADHGRLVFQVGSEIAQQGHVDLNHSEIPARLTIGRDWPAHEVMSTDDGTDWLNARIPERPVTISSRPIDLRPLQAFRFRLHIQRLTEEAVGLTCVLYGLRLRGVMW